MDPIPQFVLSTATLANPEEFARPLVGLSFKLVDTDGSPHGTRHFVLYNPFYEGIGERSAHQETKDLLLSCVKSDLQTLCFTGSRKMAELVTVWAREDAHRTSARLAETICAYRAGYFPEERRIIERQLKNGEIRGVVSTNALELGIDIGSLDAVIIDGYPGTMMSVRQQSGRSGRKGGKSLAVLVAHSNPLDQYFMHHPSIFFPVLTSMQSLTRTTLTSFQDIFLRSGGITDKRGEGCQSIRGVFCTSPCWVRRNRTSQKDPPGMGLCRRGRAADTVRLDGMAGESFRILCNGRMLETMDRAQAYREAHKGAIMLHQGETYVIMKFAADPHIRVTKPMWIIIPSR